MARTAWLFVVAAAALAPISARAQSCVGYPAFPTGNVNLSVDGLVGADFGGAGVDVNFGKRKSGPFASVGAGMIHYVSEPKETRIGFGGTVGWEHYGKDQLIWCPLFSANYERGGETSDGTGGTQRISGTTIGVGIGAGFEIERKGPLAFNPFLTGRLARVTSKIEGTARNLTVGETGALLQVGVGVRLNEAIQITPSMNVSTLEQSTMVFDLRFSIALQFKKNK